MLTGDWVIIDHMVKLQVGNTELLVDGGMTMREALQTLIINANVRDLETNKQGQPKGEL